MLPALLAAVDTVDTIETTTTDTAAAGAALAGLGVFMIFWVIVGLVGFIYWLWMFIDALKRSEEEYTQAGGGSKVLWIVLIFFLGFIGALLYHILVKNKVKAAPAPKQA